MGNSPSALQTPIT